ncbi:hypothetical protein Gpo141_00013111 [Globisporangium polare]
MLLLPAPLAWGLSCAFTRRNCAHKELFTPQYMRTNRLKGTKIMRCFPHCCPQHVERSYCGASVYLQVDLDEPEATETWDSDRRDALDDENLLVFGRFRLQNVRGPTVGEQISMDTIDSSLLSETNPTGEWVDARMIASAGHNAWLFEINPSAKWFYDWEVGAARDRRTMPHVFEAYVFQKASSPHPPPTGTRAASRNPASENLEVVALVTSSPFTLISFRRAPAARAVIEHSGDDQEHSYGRFGDATAAAERSRDVVAREETYFRLSELFERRSDFAGDLDLDLDVFHSREHDQDSEVTAKEREVSSNSSAASRVASAARSTMVVNQFLLRIPLRAALPFARVIEQNLSTALSERLEMSSNGGATPSFVTATSRRPRLSTFLSRLMTPTHTVDGNRRRAHATDSDNQLMELGVNLVLWLLFDSDNNAQMKKFVRRSAKVLLDRDALYQSFQAWTEWLHERIDELIVAQGWSLADLVAQVETMRTDEVGAVDAFFAADAHVAASHRVFVAQVRELYVSALSLSPKAQFARIRIHPQPRSATQVLNDSDSVALSQFTGVWLCDLDEAILQVGVCGVAHTDDQDQFVHDQEPIGIMTLLWIWKQLGCIRIAFSSENGVPAFLIGSLFNPSLASSTTIESVTRIALDEQPHYFRCLPCGESSMGVRLGRQSFGDYVATVGGALLSDPVPRHVEIKCYSWPSPGTSSLWPCLSPPPPVGSQAAAAFCWSWRLSTHIDDHSGEAVMSANLRISSSHLTLDAGGDLGRERDPSLAVDLETWPLAAKLARAHHWEPIYELDVRYRHLGA